MNQGIVKKPKVLIVVPIYNGEKNLLNCIEHLVHQTYLNIEIIIVDDGSTDDSSMICDDIAAKHNNIICIHQENQGVSIARNTGMKYATGDYIMFCDCDDYYECDAVEKLVSASNQGVADIVLGGVKKHFKDREEFVYCPRGTFEGEEKGQIILLMQQNFMLNQMWGKLFKRDIIEKEEIFLNQGMSIGEDLEWMCRFMMHASTIVCIDDTVYHYNIENEDSLSKRFYSDYFTQIDISYASVKALFEKENLWELNKNDLMRYQLQNYWNGICAVNRKKGKLSTADKIKYLRNGENAVYYWEYLGNKDVSWNSIKRVIMSIYPLTLRLILLKLMGK